MSEVRCPEYGAFMRVRTAQKGRNAGRQFYGCSRYPRCKGTIDIESVPPTQIQPELEIYSSLPLSHRLSARERFEGYQSRFIEDVAVPQDLLLMINDENLDESILQAFSQWRLDFPTNEVEYKLDDP